MKYTCGCEVVSGPAPEKCTIHDTPQIWEFKSDGPVIFEMGIFPSTVDIKFDESPWNKPFSFRFKGSAKVMTADPELRTEELAELRRQIDTALQDPDFSILHVYPINWVELEKKTVEDLKPESPNRSELFHHFSKDKKWD